MNEELRPDLLVNLGDDIEDESRDADLARYTECQDILRTAKAELVNVAGNHDTIHLTRDDLARIWRQRRARSSTRFDRGGFHLVVLHTLERKDVDVRIPQAQLEWLAADLARTTLPVVVLMHHSASEQDLERLVLVQGARASRAREGARRAARASSRRAARCASSSTATCTGTTST